MTGVSRAEGYRLGAPKEEAALACAEDFLARLLGLPPEAVVRVEGAEANYLTGDLRLPSGATLEVKSQPIDPVKYAMNFVEVAEVTASRRHADGFGVLASLLAVDVARVGLVSVVDYRSSPPSSAPLGTPEFLSVSIRSMHHAVATIYVNPGAGHLYLYRRDEIVGLVQDDVLRHGLRRGQGRSNDATLAVMVRLPRWVFWRSAGGLWHYRGAGRATQELGMIRSVLLATQEPLAAKPPPSP